MCGLVLVALLLAPVTGVPGAEPPGFPAATEALLCGRYDEALTGFEKGLATDTKHIPSVLGAVEALLEKGRYQSAEKKARAAVQTLPASAACQNKLGEILALTGRYADAEKAFRKAVELDANSLDARLNLGLLLHTLGRQKEASSQLDFFVNYYNSRSVKDPHELVCIGRACQRLEMFHDANRVYHDAIRADKRSVEAYLARAEIFIEKYNTAYSRADLKEVLKINPNCVRALVGLSLCFFADGNLTKAEQHCRKALETNPDCLDAHDLLAMLHAVDDRYDEAEAELAKSLSINANSLSSRAILASCYLLSGREAEFGAERKRVLALNPKFSDLFVIVANACVNKRRTGRAQEMFKQGIKLNPRSARALAGLGMLHLREGRMDTGTDLLEKSHAIDSFNVRTYNTLRLLDEMEKYRTYRSEHFVLKLLESKDAVLADYALAHLEKAYAAACKQFEYEVSEPIIVEVFPEHQWLSARTVGLPHVGIIGVCFGKVIAMDSPAARGPGSFNWELVLTHELTHVMNLTETDKRIPHWLTEGLAVYQEQSPRPHLWNKLLVAALRRNRFVPLQKLTSSFTRPQRPHERSFAYCQSEVIVEYIIKTYGWPTMVSIVKQFRRGTELSEAIESSVRVKYEDFEEAALAYARSVAAGLKVTPLYTPFDLSELEECVKEDPKNAALRCDLAIACLSCRRRDKAIEEAKQALKLDPHLAEAHTVLGQELLRREKLGEAGRHLREAKRRDPHHCSPPFLLGRLYEKQGNRDKAIEELALSCKLYPLYPHTYMMLAKLCKEAGRPAEALAHLERLIEIDSSAFPACKELAEEYVKQGRHEKAVATLRKAMAVNPYEAAVHRRLGESLLSLKQLDGALAELRVAAKLGPKDANTQAAMAQAYLMKGAAGAAEEAAKKALELDPNLESPKALLRRLRRSGHAPDDPPRSEAKE